MLNELFNCSFMLELFHSPFLSVHLFDSVVLCEFLHHLSSEILVKYTNTILPSIFFLLFHRSEKAFFFELHLKIPMTLELESIIDSLLHLCNFLESRLFFLLVECQLTENIFVLITLRSDAFELFCQLI